MTAAAPVRTRSADATEGEGRRLAARLRAGDVVNLEGDLAAGKTTFVRGLLGGLGGEARQVSSPSFVILHTYECRRGTIRSLHHVDLYRLHGTPEELREVGLEDTLSDAAAVTAVEWPKEAVATWVPIDARVWRVRFTVEADDSRMIEMFEPGDR